jgi:hypothetical protein
MALRNSEGIMTLAQIKTELRAGQYAWPGGYPKYFITYDGAALSFAVVRECWREVVSAHLTNDKASGWYIEAADVNWEDANLACDHTNKPIECAYGDPANE